MKQAAGRIIILGCGALDAGNIAAVRARTGLTEMHFAALKDVASGMRFRNPHVGMGGTDLDREYRNTLTDGAAVAATIAAAREAGDIVRPSLHPGRHREDRCGRSKPWPCCCAGFASRCRQPAAAQDIDALYRATAIVTGTGEANRQIGFRIAMEDVIVRVSGDYRLITSGKAASTVADAAEPRDENPLPRPLRRHPGPRRAGHARPAA